MLREKHAQALQYIQLNRKAYIATIRGRTLMPYILYVEPPHAAGGTISVDYHLFKPSA